MATALVSAIGLVACAEPQYPQAQTARAVALEGDRYWVVGRYGFAAEGRGARLSRADFPETGRTPSWAREAMMGSGGYVVELQRGGRTSFPPTRQTYLLTYGGEIFRRDASRWTPLDTRFGAEDAPPGEDSAQIDEVLVTPDGHALVHVHATHLFEVDGGGLETGVMKRESLPHFFTWLGFVHGVLHGVGWEGDDRAVMVREAPNRWSKVVVVPKKLGEPAGVVPLDDGRLAIVVGGGLHAVEHGALGPLAVDELVPKRARAPLIVAADGAPSSVAAPVPEAPTTLADDARPAPSNRAPDGGTAIASAEPMSPPRDARAQVAAEAPTLHGNVQAVLRMGPDRYALPIGDGYSGAETIVILGRGGVRVVACDILRARRPIGVVEAPDGTVYVPTDRASVVEIRADGACGEPQAPLLVDE